MSCALTNLSSASYTQLKTLARTPLSDRIAMLLIRLRDLAAREGRDLREIALTHGDVASLVATDRVSATRALHRLESDGLIELGYRSIGLTGLLEARADLKADTVTEFHVPCAG